LTRIARLVVEEGAVAAPCAVVGAAIREAGAWSYGWGATGALWPDTVAPGAPEASIDTVFDLASLTKPVTALTLARLEARGVVSRSETLADVWPAMRNTATSSVPLDLLLAHRAGLIAHNPFYEALVRGEQPQPLDVLLAAADMRRPECSGPVPIDGFPAVYSDLGYLLIGAALEVRAGASLDELMACELGSVVSGCIGSMRQLRAREAEVDERIAPTEVVAWRGGLVRGEVHDENAWLIAADRCAGHAGLFGDVTAVVSLGVAVLDALAGRSSWLSPAEVEPLVRARPGGSHAAGFDRRSEEAVVIPASGKHFGPDTFGHLGFTGTSIWIDRGRELVGVLLTNRVCPTREHIAIRRVRPLVYDAIFAEMTEPAPG
jgi:CubicO group peptidase (beta-lactamase class C family)